MHGSPKPAMDSSPSPWSRAGSLLPPPPARLVVDRSSTQRLPRAKMRWTSERVTPCPIEWACQSKWKIYSKLANDSLKRVGAVELRTAGEFLAALVIAAPPRVIALAGGGRGLVGLGVGLVDAGELPARRLALDDTPTEHPVGMLRRSGMQQPVQQSLLGGRFRRRLLLPGGRLRRDETRGERRRGRLGRHHVGVEGDDRTQLAEILLAQLDCLCGRVDLQPTRRLIMLFDDLQPAGLQLLQ